MSDLPELIVDDNTAANFYWSKVTFRVDGPLPIVPNGMRGAGPDGMERTIGDRPLRAGDRVKLAAYEPPFTPDMRPYHPPVPLATATVAKIEKHIEMTGSFALVTVTDVEAL